MPTDLSTLETAMLWRLYVEPVTLPTRFATFSITRAFLVSMEQGFSQGDFLPPAITLSSVRGAFTSVE